MQLKRCFLSIHQGMLSPPFIEMPDNETAMTLYWEQLIKSINRKEYTAGALAIEMAPKTGTLQVELFMPTL